MFDAVMSLGPGEEIEALRDMVRRFAAEEIAPRAQQIDAANEFPADLWQKMEALGLLGITVSEEDGGSGMGYLAHCVALEEISRATASVDLSYGAHSNLCINQLRPKLYEIGAGTSEIRRMLISREIFEQTA